MKKSLILIIICFSAELSSIAQVENTSYLNNSNEKVLRLSAIVPLDKMQSWEYFTKDDKLSEWIAPLVHIELRSGGYMVTNYDKTKTLADSSSIRLGIVSYLQNDLLILKVKLNNKFPGKARAEDQNLQEIIQFDSVSPSKTKITSSMIGWGRGPEWDTTYNFFARGNEWTYNEFLKLFK